MRKFRASLLGCCLLFCSAAHAGFRDDFDRPLVPDSTAAEGWTWRTGDGRAKVEFSASDGVGRVAVDATSDRRNIWWAIIRRQVSPAVDVARLAQPGTELRVEARVRTSHAPRRINLHFNTPRTTDFHGNLLEFDLPTAGEWHTVSMTTRDFDARPEDRVFVQLALMDWGLGRYQVDVDYLQVDVVDAATAPPDVGDGQPYHPPPPAPESLRHAIDALHSATVDRLEPDANLHDWSAIGRDGPQRILGISGTP
ncbi:MAG TPA: hypothetical protein VEQ65_01485, partial [Opitutus sp.]|nr:hypothetical protein [Opitutus sp.]